MIFNTFQASEYEMVPMYHFCIFVARSLFKVPKNAKDPYGSLDIFLSIC